jgi:pilus assembly protein CpaC
VNTKLKTLGLGLALLTLFGSVTSAMAQEPERIPSINTLIVPLYHSKAVGLERAAARVSVGNPDIADILILRASQLYVIGKDLGTTNVLLWDSQDNLVGNFDVQITHDLEDLKRKLFELLPDENVEVFSAQRSIVLRGTVSSIAAMDAALSIANGYLAEAGTSVDSTEFQMEEDDENSGKVINLMQVGGGQQVMLEVKVAEIERATIKRMQAQFNVLGTRSGQWSVGGVNGGATFPDAIFGDAGLREGVFSEPAPFGPVIDEFAPNDLQIQDQGLFASFLSSSAIFNLALDAAKEKGLAKILAEPTLTTLTGEQASFLSGGEFPIPVPNGSNGTTIEFKEFGIKMEFLPVVLGNGKINFRLNVSVSELINDGSVTVESTDGITQFLPRSLRTRNASVTLELNDGETMGMAGLINESLREAVTKFPGLGEVPVLGALFRSQEFQNRETELVILVTPRLAKPLSPEDITLPTDGFVEPTDLEFYLLGRTEGQQRNSTNEE